LGSDKIHKLLEKQLKILAQQIRLDILKKLYSLDKPISFSRLQREVSGANGNSANFSFHLKLLKEIEVINSDTNGYRITSLGTKILKKLISIEQILNDENKTIMIRTSKYSKEPFNINKIEEYLVREGEMETFLAKKIAEEVKIRLGKTTIDYLTAPLMREYINGVLIENNLEVVRKKLTRLGTPPYEAFKIFNGSNLTPPQFINVLGSDVSEQFLLLNLLPSNLADMYLSGEIVLLHLGKWSLRPLSISLSSNTWIDIISKIYSVKIDQMSTTLDYVKFIVNSINYLYKLKNFFSEDILLNKFNTFFLSFFSSIKETKRSELLDFLLMRILDYNKHGHPTLNLIFHYDQQILNHFENEYQFLKILNNAEFNDDYNIDNLIFFDYSLFSKSKIGTEEFFNLINPKLLENIIFYQPETYNFKDDVIILDQVLINLPLIAMEANQDDDIFMELLQNKVKSIFKLYTYKEEFITKKLGSLNSWKTIISSISKNPSKIIENSIRSLSFFGLNQAVKTHCGIEMDRLTTSKTFALNILNIIQELITEENEKTNLNYNLSQFNHNNFLFNLANGYDLSKEEYLDYYSPRIVRRESPLTLQKKISLFKKFESILKGKAVFNIDFNSNKLSSDEMIKNLSQAQLSAFRFRTSKL